MGHKISNASRLRWVRGTLGDRPTSVQTFEFNPLAAPPAGFEPAHTAPEAVALSPELWGLTQHTHITPTVTPRARSHERAAAEPQSAYQDGDPAAATPIYDLQPSRAA